MKTRALVVAAAALVTFAGACNKNKNTDAMADSSATTDQTIYMVYQYPSETTTTLASIKTNASDWDGRSVQGEVEVTSTPTDRGFWIEGPAGTKMFALIIDEPYDAYKDIDPGQTLKLKRAVIYTPERLSMVPGQTLSTKSKIIAQNQQAFLVVDENDLNILASNDNAPMTNR